ASVDAKSGAVHVIARDSSKTFVEIGPPTFDPVSWYVTKDGADAFWWSERDGWSHVYRLDAGGGTAVAQAGAPAGASRATTANGEVDLSTSKFRSGMLKNQVTTGEWDVGQIEYVDEANKYVYFTARGREPGVPYYARLYRVGYDGSGLTVITPEDAHHDIDFSPNGKYFVDSYSRVEKAPVTVLRAVPDGHIVRKLEDGDVSRLQGSGWKPAQVFSVKARDGVTDLYGVIYLPAKLDTTTQYKFIDLDRVGIFGHSGGGFASTDAILRYPDFFKVAVSGAGNHDNRSYNIYWAEKYQGLMNKDTLRKSDNFEGSANKMMAKNLRGHLLLMHGDMDDNVHPANTIQVVDELIKA